MMDSSGKVLELTEFGAFLMPEKGRKLAVA